MKNAILGLRKRESYDELINDLNHDPIRKYPDRTASEIENSNYLSQLRGGIEQMIIQNDNMMRQKMKDILLKEESGNDPHSHHERVVHESRWRPHIPPEEPTPEAEAFHTPMREPVGPPREYAPDHTTPEEIVRSRSNRKYTPRYLRNKQEPPIIQDATQVFSISTPPRSRSPRKTKSKLAHDVDDEAEKAHEMMIDDEKMIKERNQQLKELYVQVTKQMLQDSQNQSIDDIMTGRGDKRREENANPNPPQAKAKTAGWSPAGHGRWTPNEPIPKAPPPKANHSPEADHEPKGKPGRPKGSSKAKSEPASSSRDTPYAKAQAAAAAAAAAKASAQEPPRTKAIPVIKETKQKPKHETEKVVFDHFSDWFVKGIGFLVDQMQKRGIRYSKNKPKKIDKPEMIELLLKFDGKM